jgi:hypothetical protein
MITKKIISHLVLLKIIGIFVLFTLSSCFGVKSSSTKSGKKLFETFYVGEQGTQYFIKPITFFNDKNKDELQADFTFRYKDALKDSVIMNFSLETINIVKKIDSITIFSQENKASSKKVNLLFNESKGKLFKSRFSVKILLTELNKLFQNKDWKIQLYFDGTTQNYLPENSTKNAIKKLNDKVFILFQ